MDKVKFPENKINIRVLLTHLNQSKKKWEWTRYIQMYKWFVDKVCRYSDLGFHPKNK